MDQPNYKEALQHLETTAQQAAEPRIVPITVRDSQSNVWPAGQDVRVVTRSGVGRAYGVRGRRPRALGRFDSGPRHFRRFQWC